MLEVVGSVDGCAIMDSVKDLCYTFGHTGYSIDVECFNEDVDRPCPVSFTLYTSKEACPLPGSAGPGGTAPQNPGPPSAGGTVSQSPSPPQNGGTVSQDPSPVPDDGGTGSTSSKTGIIVGCAVGGALVAGEALVALQS
jgi:hypothetical protein